MDEIMILYGILEEHCLMDPDRDCSNTTAPDCVYCLAQYLVKKGVVVKGGKHAGQF